MDWYTLFRHLHITTAVITTVLFTLRIGLDLAGVRWRQGPLRWLPHVNDTLLLSAAIALVVITPWMPFVHHWLTGKILLLCGYIIAGLYALGEKRPVGQRIAGAFFAYLQLAAIFVLAFLKPGF